MENNWKLEEFKASEISYNIKNNIFVVPRYQRMIQWKQRKMNNLIDTIKKGLPFGCILLHCDDNHKYQIIDGLQRSNTICEFIKNPAKYFERSDIDELMLDQLYQLMGINSDKDVVKNKIVEIITNWIKNDYKTMDTIKNLQYHKCAIKIIKEFPTLEGKSEQVSDIIEPTLLKYKDMCSKMSDINIPAIVIYGDQKNLPTIFERINSTGLPLTKWQIYSATWIDKLVSLDDDLKDIVEYNKKRYDSLTTETDIELANYDSIKFIKDNKLTIFELIFGFGKLISNKYNYLFGGSKNINDVDSVGFNLVNACLGLKTSEIENLQDNILKIVGTDSNINNFLRKIIESIRFVDKTLAITTRFKSNVRNNASPIHTEYQICSMIASVFINKYLEIEIDENDKITKRVLHLDSSNSTWKEYKQKFERNAIKVSLIDIIQTEWRGSGDKKLNHVILNKEYYTRDIEKQDFENILKYWHDKIKSERQEYTRVKSPDEAERTILNIIYSNILTAGEQIDGKNLDIEHLATKEKLKKLIANLYEKGIEIRLPISSIGNLCFLPEGINRGKREKTIYQVGLSKDEMNTYETKYTFTTHDDLKWIEDDYINREDLIYKYNKFIDTRFEKLRTKLIKVLYPDNKT